MNTNLPTPQPIGGAHAHAPIIAMEVRYAENIEQVVVDFATYDGAQVFSIQLEVAAAAQLAEELTDAVRTAEHHQDQGDVLAEFDQNRLRRDQEIGDERRRGDAS